jgi:hypothetical protein
MSSCSTFSTVETNPHYCGTENIVGVSQVDIPNPEKTLPTTPFLHPMKATDPVQSIIPASPDTLPPLIIFYPINKWSNKLGHENYTIFPEPYIPKVCDRESLEKLIFDWNCARINFLNHEFRIQYEYSTNSETFLLTKQKWEEIEVQWREIRDFVIKNSPDLTPSIRIEPTILNITPITKKFPHPGDGGIIGPMEQFAPFEVRQNQLQPFQ